MTDDDWVKAAMADDSIVGDLLLHLNRTLPSPPPPPPQKPNTPAFPLDWRVRQRRSRTMILPANKKPISTRASPTTPLSWSGATSGSGGGGGVGTGGGASTVDGFEESSRPPTKRCSSLSRSKVIGTSEATSSKRPRKKKTLAELKVEEDLLLKERKYLHRKLESMRDTLEKQRTENESLKRVKRELSFQSESKIVTAVTPISHNTTPEKTTQMVAECDVTAAFPKPMQSLKEVVEQGYDSFVLPDLNVPVEEEFS